MIKNLLLLVSLVFLFTGCTPTLGLGGGDMGAGKKHEGRTSHVSSTKYAYKQSK